MSSYASALAARQRNNDALAALARVRRALNDQCMANPDREHFAVTGISPGLWGAKGPVTACAWRAVPFDGSVHLTVYELPDTANGLLEARPDDEPWIAAAVELAEAFALPLHRERFMPTHAGPDVLAFAPAHGRSLKNR